MSLLYCGIDEAGYGPMLGPMTMAAAVLRLHDHEPASHTPNLWTHLRAGVARELRTARGRVVVADSKRLKLANSGKQHPLTHLERGVLGFLGCRGEIPGTDVELLETLGVVPARPSWYAGDPLPLPTAHDQASLRLASNQLAGHLARRRVELVCIACVSVDEPAFNALLAREGTKAGVVAAVTARLVEKVRDCLDEADELRLVLDRQSGRTKCAGLLRALGEVEAEEESMRASLYRCPRGRVLFMPEAENHHMPVALASMTAKYVRELAMARFNRYWSARIPEIKPTAGYVTDARRWLRDAGAHITPDERRTLVRNA